MRDPAFSSCWHSDRGNHDGRSEAYDDQPPLRGSARRIAGLILLASLICFSAHAGGYATPYQSAAAAALSGAVGARQGDPSSMFYNVATLSSVRQRIFLAGAHGVDVESNLVSLAAQEPEMLKSHFFVLPHLYLASPLNERVTIGIGLSQPWGLRVDNANDATFSGRFVSQDSSLSVISLQPSIAIRSLDARWAAGVGLSWSSSRLITQKNLPLITTGGTLDIANVRLKSDRSDGWNYTVGLLYSPGEAWTFGLSYRSPMTIEYNGKATVRQILTGVGEIDSAVAAMLPPSQGFQTEIPYASSLRGAVRYQLWSSNIEIDVQHDRNSRYRTLDISFVQTPSFDTSISQNWRDSTSVHLGFEHELGSRWRLRTGASFEETPMPIETVSPTFADSDRLGFSLGTGWSSGPWVVDTAFVYQDFRDRDTAGRSTSGIDGIYSSNVSWFSLDLGYRF